MLCVCVGIHVAFKMCFCFSCAFCAFVLILSGFSVGTV